MSLTDFTALAYHVDLWRLQPDGIPFDTPQSWLLPVRHRSQPALLKICKASSDERHTAALLDFYAGDGAVRMILAKGPAVLMERACGVRSAWALATEGCDDEAADILGGVVKRLHAPRQGKPPTGLITLPDWFSVLFRRRGQSMLFAKAADTADELLASPTDQGVLHGDLHHNNVVHDTTRGWLAIDPKGLWGERAYDVANYCAIRSIILISFATATGCGAMPTTMQRDWTSMSGASCALHSRTRRCRLRGV